jgi:hypothetical protein
MTVPWTPMRWPRTWKDAAAVDLLAGSAIDCLLIDGGAEFEAVRGRAREKGLHTRISAGVTTVQGEWPGVRISRRGGDSAESGPTGVPWINSNGWLVQLTAALHPDSAIWVDAKPQEQPHSYLMAIADAAAHGGRWIVTLDDALAAAIATGAPAAVEKWKSIASATSFFAARKSWAGYSASAEIGLISDFAGPNEFLSHELLNLIARAGQHCRPLPKSRPPSLDGLRAVVYADAEPMESSVRKQVQAFVQKGGLLIETPHSEADDPFVMANDIVVKVSHRYDLVRFWNGGATGSVLATSPDRSLAIAHFLFYSDRGPDAASVRIAGRFRTVKASAPGLPNIPVQVQPQKDAVEVHLPQVPPYVALELHS